jgi:hypothetical protein
MLVALAPIAARASFVIDTFNGSQGSNYTLANGLSVVRTTDPFKGTTAFTGTSVVFTQNAAATGALPSGMSVNYSFSNTIGSVDSLGGTPAIDLKFNSVTGNNWLVSFEWFSDNAFTTSIGSASGAIPASAGTLFTSTALGASFLNAQSLTMTIFRQSGTSGSFDLSNVTATPEPTTLLLFGSVAGMGFVARRRMKKKVA